MRVFLSGPMGSGKTTVGRVLAAGLGTAFVDLDEAIAADAGADVPSLFAREGEEAFRAREARVLADVLARPGPMVLALGGGTVLRRASRRRLLGEGVLVTLEAPVDVLARRVGAGAGRPLLGGASPGDRLAVLREERADAYAECHAAVDAADEDPVVVAARVREVLDDVPVVVALGRRTYRVEVGRGNRVRSALRAAQWSGALVVSDEATRSPWGEDVARALGERTRAHLVLPSGELHKNLGSVERLWDAALDAGLDRAAGFLAVGGGVVGDVTGFAASTLLRGVAFGQVPTTVLAMVDSAVGGKTGIDRAQGKNLVGTFHQPSFVLADVDTLATLSAAERTSGLAEVVKSAWLAGEAEVALMEARAAALVRGDLDAFADVIRMGVALKARIVSEDERESGPRALLNLGHTLGHAMEAGEGYRLRHGEAVALGMVAAFQVAARLGDPVADHAARLTGLLRALGLPTDVAAVLRPAHLAFLRQDKKRRGEAVRFVVPGAPGATRVEPVSLDVLAGLWAVG